MRGRLARLTLAQSAFTMRDLLNVACAHDPDGRLQVIYQWYFDRTKTAIQVAYGAATAAAAAIYGLTMKHVHGEEALTCGLAATVIVCVLAGIFQRRELAQLHAEFAAASRLLADVRCLARDQLCKPRERAMPNPSILLMGWIVLGLLAALLGVIGLVAAGLGLEQLAVGPVFALTALTVLVAVLASPHIFVEMRTLWPDPTADCRLKTLEEVFGDVRLDTYLMNPTMTSLIDEAVAARPKKRVQRDVMPPDQGAAGSSGGPA